jgi:hypothetical protein
MFLSYTCPDQRQNHQKNQNQEMNFLLNLHLKLYRVEIKYNFVIGLKF